MSKRKRSLEYSTMSSTNGLKNPSTRRRNHEPDAEIVCIDLESETGNQNRWDEASTSKKKRVDVIECSKGKSKENQKLNHRVKLTADKSPNYHTPLTTPSSRNNDKGTGQNSLEDSDSEEFTTAPIFKIPSVPVRPNLGPVSQPSTSANAEVSKKKSKIEQPTKKQLETTKLSRELRSAFIAAIQDALEETSECSQGVQLENLVSHFSSCIPSRMYIFATRRLPDGATFDDKSRDSEVEEFARWCIFGITALLFSCPESEAKKTLQQTKIVLFNLCQLLVCGHPTVVDKIAVQLFKILKVLLVRNDCDSTAVPVIKLNLYKTDATTEIKEYFDYEVIIPESNDWITPHYIQAICPLLNRICFHNVELFNLWNCLLERLLRRQTSSETISTVLCSFPQFSFTGAHSFYLTEDVFSSIFKMVLEAPTLSKIDMINMRQLFSQYDNLQNHRFTEFLQDSGVSLLQMGIKDFFYSDKLAVINRDDLNIGIVRAFRFLVDGTREPSSLTEEIVPLMRLLSEKGLGMVMHPLLEKIVVSQICSNVLSATTESRNVAHNPRLGSTVYERIFRDWDDSLSTEYRSCMSRQNVSMISEESQLQTVSFFTNTAILTKLIGRIMEQLKDFNQRFQFFELKHVQRWADITFQSLASFSRFSEVNFCRLYTSILETIEHLDSCNWFGNMLSAKLLNNLISIPGWLWLPTHHGSIPSRLKPLPMFARGLKRSDTQFLRKSSMLTSKALRCLRLEIFRPWFSFVSEIYASVMEAPTTCNDSFLVRELLLAIGNANWIFKEVISLKATFTFLNDVIRTDLWKLYSCVRSALAAAIVALPCICHYNSGRNRSKYHSQVEKSRSGCEKKNCVSFVQNSAMQTDRTSLEEDFTDLSDFYISKIVKLILPVLKSRFFLLKLNLTELITSCHNHTRTPSSSLIISMIEVALDGHTSLCDEIFRRIGIIVANAVPRSPDGATNTHGADVDIAQKIFSSAIPKICTRKQTKNTMNKLSLGFREKIIKGILAFSEAGPMNMTIFVEIMKCIIPILAKTKGHENSVTILTQKIVIHFAEGHGCQPHELMSRIRYEISKCIVKSALSVFYPFTDAPKPIQAFQDQKLHMCVKFIERLKYIGKFRVSFVRYMYPPLLELIVPRITDPRYQFLLACLASQEKLLESIVLQEYIMNYFPTLLLDHPSETIVTCLGFLKKYYRFDAMFAATQQEQRILNETLCRLSDREDKVLRFLPHLCNWEEQSSQQLYSQGTANKAARSELQELLNKRLLGFFIHLDTKLQSRIETVETKQKIVKSFTALIKLMGKNRITPVRFKVYKTLYSSTKEGPQFYEVLYDAWREFANNLDSTNFALMTPQILASLLPLRQSSCMRTKVDGLIAHFVCFKNDLTSSLHHELYFLLDQCDDENVLQYIGQAVDAMTTHDWSDFFNMIVKQASNENQPIRYEAFRKLCQVFRNDWAKVEKFVLVKGQEYVSEMISTMLVGLRGTCNSEADKLRSIILDCFGCVGALDPVRFRSEKDDGNSKNSLSTSLAISCQMNTFIVLYLGELIREFQEVKDTTNFDYCACLIQIVLKEFKLKPFDPEDKICKFLTREQQEAIAPMVSTKYQMDNPTGALDISYPIYLSEHGQNFESWLINWMCTLISYITKQERKAHSLFVKSMNVLKTNVRIATFIIPFVAMYAVICATMEQRALIVAEIKTILERWVILDEMKQKAQSTAAVRDSEFEHGLKEEPMSVENESIFHARCTQVIFSILDHLLRSSCLAKRKLGIKRTVEQSHRHRSHQLDDDPRYTLPMTEENMKAIESVLGEIPTLLISEVACNCASFPAALYYLEQTLKTDSKHETFQKNVDYLQRVYICLDDMDSVGGIGAVRESDASFAGHILENIVNGKTQECVKSLEQMALRDTNDFQLHQALIRAYLKVEEPHAAQTFIQATLVGHPEWELDLQEVHMEALMKLQKWPELNTKVTSLEKMKDNQYLKEKFLTWNVAMPRIISKLQCTELEAAATIVSELKSELIAPLVATCEDLYPYKRAYPHILQLHILTEVEEAIDVLRKYIHETKSGKSASALTWIEPNLTELVDKWERRLWNISKSRKMIDQVLNVRKNILQIMKATFQSNTSWVSTSLDASIRECWLDAARDASKCGDFVRADNCLQEAKRFMSPKVMIEEAKILNRKGEKENAIYTLQKGIAKWFPNKENWKSEKGHAAVRAGRRSTNEENMVRESKLLCSKALLLLASLCEEQKLFNMEDYIAKYKEATDVCRDSEKNFFTLGSYYDRLWSTSDKSMPCFDIQATVVRYYAQSLYYGCKYVYQSLPRLLSIWFDFAAGMRTGEHSKHLAGGIPSTAPSTSSSTSSSAAVLASATAATMENMKNSISRMHEAVPAYVLMTAFTQLISRLCHAHVDTWSLLKSIIVRIVKTHPYQTLWMTMAVHKSINPMRHRRCTEIYKSIEKERTDLRDTIHNYTNLTERLIGLCDKAVPKEQMKVSLQKIYDKLPKLLRQIGAGKISIPFQVFMNPSLPRKGISHKEHNPYPESLVFIEGIDDTVDVMVSLIRPKKITLIASNGKRYSLLCKPKDDLRKDSKVMEVNNVVNCYLSQNSESSQRRLHVRTYAVVPLNEECGLLEWVPNLNTFRSVTNSLYKEKSITPFRGQNPIHLHDEIEIKMKKFRDVMLKNTPPVFGDWFFNQFNDHQAWYTARMSYIRTAAVISIVGYVMGLGDRHLENILLDTESGEVVHVDFNCLFNKGETFEWMERVPFRLTQNMIHGMGPLKYEGVFRKSCEIVMNIFREHKSIFLSVLRPFVFDPLVEWQKLQRGSIAALEAGEFTNEKAVETMKYIRHRLNGTARNMMKDINTELSVKAHVDYLIEEAICIENLCQMWIGWAAFM